MNANMNETTPAADVFIHHGIIPTPTWCNVAGSFVKNGRKYRITCTSSRATLHACNSATERSDGYEVARVYAAPCYSIPLLLQRAAE